MLRNYRKLATEKGCAIKVILVIQIRLILTVPKDLPMYDVQQLSASPLNRDRVEIQFCITGLGQKQGVNGKPNLRQKIQVFSFYGLKVQF